MWSLIGVAIIVIGLALRLNPLLVILTSGFATGLVADMSVVEIIEAIGASFTKNRYMSLFILVLPVIGLLERYGLRERAEDMIRSMKTASTGRIIVVYMVFRKVTNAFGLHLGGHPTMVRPLVSPMAEAAAAEHGQPSHKISQKIRAMSAASENFGNFFSQLMFIAAGGLLLVKGVLGEAGYDVSLERMASYAIPTAIASLVVMAIRMKMLDNEIKKSASGVEEAAETAQAKG